MINFETEIQQNDQTNYSLIAIDIGYSRDRATCGIMHDGIEEPQVLTFGAAIESARQHINADSSKIPILVIEAVLSTFHNKKGNPDIRGDFERGRGWYYGAGAVTLLAALRFLNVLRDEGLKCSRAVLAEAFLSFHQGPSDHARDSMSIYKQFWLTEPEDIKHGAEPIAKFISGVPTVRVFSDGQGV